MTNSHPRQRYAPDSVYDQSAYAVRCEWGLQGVQRLARISEVTIIVDVLSFTTCVDLTVNQGALLYPYVGAAEDLPAFAAQVGAEVAGAQHPDGYSLSPSTLQQVRGDLHLVLPSPNGSTLSLHGADSITLAGCLRNAQAVAQAAAEMGRAIAVIPAGERWPDGSLRPSLEDWLGAGAIVHYLAAHGTRSPEAESAAAAFAAFDAPRLHTLLSGCISGLEKGSRNQTSDVELAAALNSSDCVPILQEGAYRQYRAA